MWNNLSSGLLLSRYIPHGHCYLWQTPLVGLHAVSDIITAIAYLSIPVALTYFICKRQHAVPVRISLLFSSFILLCGIGHLFDVITLWYPVYWLSGSLKAATALISGYTAVEITILLPKWLSLPDLEIANQELQAQAQTQEAAKRKLEESQRIFRSAFYDIPTGMVLVSLNGVVQEANEAILQILGYAKEEILSLNFKSITHPDDLDIDRVLINELISGKRRSYRLEKRYFHKLGHAVPVELSVSLLRDVNDKPSMFIAHINDVSNQHRINAFLKAATKEAEAANRAKSDFLAMMSHEIRTPMNAMLGMAELIEDTPIDQQQQSLVKAIRTSGKTLLTVINDVLDFSKIESNKLELEAGQIDLYECVKDVVTLFSNQAQSKGLKLFSNIEPDCTPNLFKGDSVRLRQILSNLVSNSIKFTEEGEINIHVKVDKSELESGDALLHRLHFSVQDTGIGIEQHKISNLFEPFSQIDSSVTRKHGGTGLGLSISKRLVDIMDGSLWVDSESGKGSTFHFSITLESDEADEANAFEPSLAGQQSPVHSAAKTAAKTAIKLRPLRILLTEDIELNQKVALHMLSSYGYQADIANNGKEAVEVLKHQSYDLVLMDIQMPDLDGLEATKQIRATLNIHQPYIVAMTANAMQGDKEKCLAVGMDDYISKPISKRDLLAVLQQCPPIATDLVPV